MGSPCPTAFPHKTAEIQSTVHMPHHVDIPFYLATFPMRHFMVANNLPALGPNPSIMLGNSLLTCAR